MCSFLVIFSTLSFQAKAQLYLAKRPYLSQSDYREKRAQELSQNAEAMNAEMNQINLHFEKRVNQILANTQLRLSVGIVPRKKASDFFLLVSLFCKTSSLPDEQCVDLHPHFQKSPNGSFYDLNTREF